MTYELFFSPRDVNDPGKHKVLIRVEGRFIGEGHGQGPSDLEALADLIATLTKQEEDPEAIKRVKTAYRSSYRLLHDGQYPGTGLPGDDDSE